MLDHLPTLGVGVSLSLADRPDPVDLVRRPDGPRFVEYAGLAEAGRVLNDVDRIRSAGGTVLYHPSYLNFCGTFPNDPAWLAACAAHLQAVGSPWFAQDCAYCFVGDGHGYSTQLGYFVPPILNEASLARAVERVREVMAAIPAPVAVEPPPMCFTVGSMPLFRFFGRLSAETGCALLLDMGHLVSWEMASGQRVLDAMDELDGSRVVEVHIAGGRLKDGDDDRGPIYVDAHECGIPEDNWRMLEALLPRLTRLKAVCYECEGRGEAEVLATLQRLRRLVRERSGNPELAALAGEAA